MGLAVGSLTEEPKDYLGRKSASGRATLTAAKALLGRVYLTMAGFPLYDETKKELARELLEEVIDYADATGKFWAKNASEWQRMWINENPAKRRGPHIRDDAFVRGKVPMTKEEVRAVSIARMELTEDAVVYDVGAGTGSVSVEAALSGEQIKVYAIEKNPEAVVNGVIGDVS